MIMVRRRRKYSVLYVRMKSSLGLESFGWHALVSTMSSASQSGCHCVASSRQSTSLSYKIGKRDSGTRFILLCWECSLSGYATNNSNEQWVHIDSFSAMNGISLFCENDFPWRYSKEEDMHLDEFCQRNFTYLLNEYPKMNGFKCLFTINEFSRARFHNGFPPILLLREPKVFVHGNIANTDVMHRSWPGCS
ncbi:dol-P-Man:Man(7)GlcNAc(2)-PP-Dol alpha-1,6-mannosyltransferase-like [Cornus florida]|uniref:dol-P-Man:Man(7)GlcNAc(2)-PP-Dol alpha-1,6-mannosyltransferase-like n=1 Tax=Cornus florida TaxID=4283 RepID=UPI0028992AE3|nr:dol-P-Man:Man(7)GlcNAc(2)-PP-Dol alpha-1,6-mannosyltransferase-like [Cornus florida]